jgi:hypothetical protein
MEEASITTYGERNAQAPAALDLFAFLVGKWHGSAAQFEMTWIGRYVLDGMAVADEFHGTLPDGKPYLGISLRHFDARQDGWIIEYLNVSGSFVRRQVNPRSGSVRQDGDTIVVLSVDGQNRIRESYRVIDRSHFTYSTELSRDAGETWDPPAFALSLSRVE